MNREQFKEGAINFGKGLAYFTAIACVGAISVLGAGMEAEEEKKAGESFKKVMTAIVNSDISGYHQRSIIEKITGMKLTNQQEEAIIVLCESDMGDYYKYSSIMNIIG